LASRWVCAPGNAIEPLPPALRAEVLAMVRSTTAPARSGNRNGPDSQSISQSTDLRPRPAIAATSRLQPLNCEAVADLAEDCPLEAKLSAGAAVPIAAQITPRRLRDILVF